MTKFKADFRLHEITTVKVVKETAHNHTLESGEKLSRYGSSYNVCDTYDAAKLELVKNCKRGIDLYRTMLENELNHLEKVMEL